MSYEPAPTDANGRKIGRAHPGGHLFAKHHQTFLGAGRPMTDLDGVIFVRLRLDGKAHEHTQIPEGGVYMEYATDAYAYSEEYMRNFAIVGILDMKTDQAGIWRLYNRKCHGLFLWLCRVLAQVQRRRPLYFVISGFEPPWLMTRINQATGLALQQWYLPVCEDGASDEEKAACCAAWEKAWEESGINELRRWLERSLRRMVPAHLSGGEFGQQQNEGRL